MRRPVAARLRDILVSCDAIDAHLHLHETDEGLVFDALRIRLLEIGEAAKELPSELTATELTVPWSLLARMRDHLAHHYFDTTHAIVFDTARRDIPVLADATRRLLAIVGDERD